MRRGMGLTRGVEFGCDRGGDCRTRRWCGRGVNRGAGGGAGTGAAGTTVATASAAAPRAPFRIGVRRRAVRGGAAHARNRSIRDTMELDAERGGGLDYRVEGAVVGNDL